MLRRLGARPYLLCAGEIRSGTVRFVLAYFYDDGFLPHTESQCYLNLGQPQRAVAQAEQSLKLHDPQLVRDNAFSKLYLATT